jgi:molecular chaperone GrpE (heat shock protein)
MSESQAAPKLQKWPFYLADLVLSGIAAYVLWRLGVIQGTTQVAISIACLCAAAFGAWLSITPWLVEYRTHSSLAENSSLKGTLEQIQNLEKVADLIRQANAQWQGVQDAAGRTVVASREIADRMKTESEEFMKFMENAHDQERAGLRLEVEKLRKMEGDWLKVVVQMLDHTYGLFRAAERSGQQNLIMQLGQFQNALRDAARRMGLTPFLPSIGEKYDSRGHQLANPPPMVDENATVGEILATGFTYQGQLLRRSLVELNQNAATEEAPGAVALPEETVPAEAPAEVPVFADSPAVVQHEPIESGAEPSDGPKRQRPPDEPRDQDELPLV